MIILVAFEFSGVVRSAFRARGHQAFSCDLLPSLDCSPYHFQCDAWKLLDLNWDMIIAHHECTNLTNAGVRWLYERKDRWSEMRRDAATFNKLLNLRCSRVAIENPVMHGHALKLINRSYDQIIQPYQFGHGETKKTCLWLSGLAKLKPTNIVEGRTPRVHHESPGVVNGLTRKQRRSITYQGIADAMAEQWGVA